MTTPSIRTTLPFLVMSLLVHGTCHVEPGTGDSLAADHSDTIPSRFTMPEAYGDRDWRLKRLAELNEIARRGGIDLVFLGDSITQGWNGAGKQVWAKYYARRRAANFGMDADRAQHVLWRIEQGHFERIRPKVVILLIGTNNASNGETAQEIADGVEAVVRRLRAKIPESKLLLLAIFPAGEQPDNPQRMKAAAANVVLRTIADGRMVRYLDIGDRFMNRDGTIPQNLMPDFLHLSPDGYEVWAEAIEPALQEMLGEP
jgi:beta-glucosidase